MHTHTKYIKIMTTTTNTLKSILEMQCIITFIWSAVQCKQAIKNNIPGLELQVIYYGDTGLLLSSKTKPLLTKLVNLKTHLLYDYLSTVLLQL